MLERAERDDRELVLRLPEGATLLLADADDAEVEPSDLDHLVERIDGAEQAVGDLPAEDGHRAAAIDLDRADQPAALGVEGGEVQ